MRTVPEREMVREPGCPVLYDSPKVQLPTKGDGTALAQRWLARLLEELTAALGQADDARSGVHAVVRVYLRFVQTHPDASRLLHSAPVDREVMARAPQLRGSQEARLAPLGAWLRDRQEAGELADLPLPVLESLILGPVTGLARRWLSLGDVDLDAAARETPERIWRSVGP
ncbi:TetR/AcrR family transcriptional regulator [Streptomyces benahoarensis]|uniref:TetR/AcrR family transcriptional regulator n=1 Tax=Streptomyces benahoarensis TaxID=2595054 RepID=A0A553Y5J4_9ACTN|nr:TetR/AcrR family transcriptional regulator [Streptomyces benahoarensis]TSB15008.1 TetR/AcrR family transcriptional regulator [Streptomyces benahoarensis]TSB24480.1 TetR/AcrR family transcriptional regulator [Streptomyces benahoarensis]